MYTNERLNAMIGTGFRGLAMLMLLATLALTGCDSDAVVSPELTEEESSIQDGLTAEERMILAEAGISASKAGRVVSRAPVYTFADPFGAAVGNSLVIRQNDGVLMVLKSSQLKRGTAVTMWAVIFNAPENCTDNACGEDDLTNPEARVDILYADGKVIRDFASHTSWRDAYYFAHRRVGDTDGSIVPALFGTPSFGLEDTRTAEVHLVLRTHGPLIPALEQEMTGTFAAGCEGFPEALGTPGPNTCEDIQFAIHRPAP